LAARLRALASADADRLPAFAAVIWDAALAWLRARTGAALAVEQQAAMQLALPRRSRCSPAVPAAARA